MNPYNFITSNPNSLESHAPGWEAVLRDGHSHFKGKRQRCGYSEVRQQYQNETNFDPFTGANRDGSITLNQFGKLQPHEAHCQRVPMSSELEVRRQLGPG